MMFIDYDNFEIMRNCIYTKIDFDLWIIINNKYVQYAEYFIRCQHVHKIMLTAS